MKDRIKQLRKELGLSQDDFAKNLGLKSRGKIANIEFGKIEPDEEFVKLICKAYNVNYQWLTTGYGEAFRDDDSDAQAIIDSIMTSDDDFAKKTLVKFAKLDERQWRIINDLIDSLQKNL